ncbi:MAG: class I SAM-dependent methyltransferase [Acidimicrobiales bacterium]
MSDERAHVVRNRESWDRSADWYAEAADAQWAGEPQWGVFGVPEADVGVLPTDLADKDVIELGCGTGYVSAWVARRGGRPVGLDNSSRQLATARRLQDSLGPRFPLIWASAEEVPLRDAAFDVAISEYGASIWCDPYRWIPEAARLLRPDGELIFLANSPLSILCVDDVNGLPHDERLKRPYFGMHRIEWADEPLGVEFHLGYGDMIRLLRASGFAIEDLIEIRPPEDAATRYEWMPLEWARRWPCEHVWKARTLA